MKRLSIAFSIVISVLVIVAVMLAAKYHRDQATVPPGRREGLGRLELLHERTKLKQHISDLQGRIQQDQERIDALLKGGKGQRHRPTTDSWGPSLQPVGSTNDTTITSETMTLFMKISTVVFETDVVVTDPQFRLNADKLTVVSEGTNEVKSLRAEGHVRLRAKDGEATCQLMTYDRASGEVVLEKDARLRQPDKHMSADKIECWIQNGQLERAKGKGNVQTSYPSKNTPFAAGSTK